MLSVVHHARSDQQQQEWNFQWASNEMILAGRAAGKRSAGPVSVVAGTKPQLPAQFLFQGLILNPDPEVPVEVRMLCVASSARRPLSAVVVLLVFGLCALLWRASGLRPGTRLIVLVAVLLAATGMREIAEDNFETVLLIVQCTIAAALFVFGALALYRRLRPAPEA